MSQDQEQQKMLRARELIRSKRFAEARALLKTTRHPKTAAWLRKLDEIDPPNRAPAPSPMQQTQQRPAVSPGESRMAEPVPPYPSEAAPRGTQSVSLEDRRRARQRPVQRSNALRNFLLFIVVIGFLGVVTAGAVFFVLPQLGVELPLPALNIAGGGGATENLAGEFPANTVAYARLRTDDAYIQTLDSLQLLNSVPVAGMPAGMPLAGGLDMAIGELMPGETFATAIRPWLGDNAAVGLFNADVLFDAPSDNDSQAGIAAIVEIRSKAEAMAFFDKMMQGAVTPTEENGYTVYTIAPDPSAPIILLNDSRMIITTPAAREAMTGGGNKLDSSAAFTETTAMLPASDYNILIYADTGTIQRGLLNTTRDLLPPDQQPLMDALADFAGQQALGFTIEDERTLIMDMVQNAGDSTGLRNQNISLAGAAVPVNSAILNRIPANAGMMLAASDARSLYNFALNNAENAATMQGSDPQEIQAGLAQMTTMLESVGLNLENDILSWLTGTFAVYAIYDIPESGTPSVVSASLYPDMPYALNLNGALLVEATDAEKAKNLVEVLATQLTDAGAPLTREDIGGANAIVVAIPNPSLSAPVEVVIGANDAVFVIGTRAAVTPALVGDGNLAGSAGYTQASKYLLPNAYSIAYADTQGATLLADLNAGLGLQIGNVFAEITASFGDGDGSFEAPSLEDQQATFAAGQQEFRAIAGRIASSSISSTGDVDANGTLRMVLTLNP